MNVCCFHGTNVCHSVQMNCGFAAMLVLAVVGLAASGALPFLHDWRMDSTQDLLE
jgi:hypothetical protein